VWKEIVRPALMDTQGGALFIGTPKGKNHFHELWKRAKTAPGWKSWQFKSRDNPFLLKAELDATREDYNESSIIERRELEASFENPEEGFLKEDWIKVGDEPQDGDWYISVDLAGFEKTQAAINARGSKLDEAAIVSVKVSPAGWYVGEIESGRW